MPGYNFIYTNRISCSRGGIAIYVKSNIEYKLRDDLSIFEEAEFESILIETISGIAINVVVGDIYSNANLSLKHYEYIQQTKQMSKCKMLSPTHTGCF